MQFPKALEPKRVARQLKLWEYDLQCIAQELPLQPERKKKDLVRANTNLELLMQPKSYAEPGCWPVQGIARVVNGSRALSSTQIVCAEERTAKVLEDAASLAPYTSAEFQ